MNVLINLAIAIVVVCIIASIWIAIPILASMGVVFFLIFLIYFTTKSYREYKKEEQNKEQ